MTGKVCSSGYVLDYTYLCEFKNTKFRELYVNYDATQTPALKFNSNSHIEHE